MSIMQKFRNFVQGRGVPISTWSTPSPTYSRNYAPSGLAPRRNMCSGVACKASRRNAEAVATRSGSPPFTSLSSQNTQSSSGYTSSLAPRRNQTSCTSAGACGPLQDCVDGKCVDMDLATPSYDPYAGSPVPTYNPFTWKGRTGQTAARRAPPGPTYNPFTWKGRTGQTAARRAPPGPTYNPFTWKGRTGQTAARRAPPGPTYNPFTWKGKPGPTYDPFAGQARAARRGVATTPAPCPRGFQRDARGNCVPKISTGQRFWKRLLG